MSQNLSILIITKGEQHAHEFCRRARSLATLTGAELVIVGDGKQGQAMAMRYADLACIMYSAGYLESIYHAAVQKCGRDYVFRLDDDEAASSALIAWLQEGKYLDAELWAFPRCNLWGDRDHFIADHPLWPDLQTRLGKKGLMGGRYNIHDGATHGTGRIAPVAIEHYKFVIKDRAEREAIAANYDRVRPGAGTGSTYRYYNLPETCYNVFNVALTGSGSFGGELEPGPTIEVKP